MRAPHHVTIKGTVDILLRRQEDGSAICGLTSNSCGARMWPWRGSRCWDGLLEAQEKWGDGGDSWMGRPRSMIDEIGAGEMTTEVLCGPPESAGSRRSVMIGAYL